MGLTLGEAITRALRFERGRGSDEYARNKELREASLHYARRIGSEAWTLAPHWFKLSDGTSVLTAGVGSMPADFGAKGDAMEVYVTGRTPPLTYLSPSDLKYHLNANPTTGGTPEAYSLTGRTALGLAQISTYPSSTATLLIKRYQKRLPEMIDCPTPPAAVSGAVGLLDGAYRWVISFVHPLGETEAGFPSDTLTVALKQVALSGIPTSPSHDVTARKVYRTAASGDIFKLVGTISDNLTTTYTDNVADVTLGAAAIAPAAAVSGLEQFPDDFHESVFVDGLVTRLAKTGGDGRTEQFTKEWRDTILRMWANQRQDQGEIQIMPAYGRPFGPSGQSIRDRIPS